MDALVKRFAGVGAWALLVLSGASAWATDPGAARIAEDVRKDVEAVEARAAALSEDEAVVRSVTDVLEDAESEANRQAQEMVRAAEAARTKQADAAAAETASAGPQFTGQLNLSELLNLGEAGRAAHGMALQAQQEQAQSVSPPPRYRLYVSRGMGEVALRAVIEHARANPDMVVVFRGVLPGEKVIDLVRYLSPMLVVREGEPQPNVVIDPTAYRKQGVARVPRLERLDAEGNVLAAVHGVVNPRYLEDRHGQGERGELADAGPVSEIAEEDLIDVMRRRLEAVDWKAAGKRGVEGMWKQYTLVDLPHATEDRRREHDPSVVIPETITAPDGTVLAIAGERINPFDAMPFNITMVVIDGTVREHLVFARELVRTRPAGTVVVVTTKVDREAGWQSYGKMMEVIQQPVYLLQEIMVERFGLQKVPAVVEGGNRVLVVNEFALSGKKGESNAGG
jgi:conjugal transfer pilus assembly protein TraW